MDIQETKDVIAYVKQILDKLAEAKADDGKIDTAEILAAFTSTAPAAVSAIMGSWNVAEELKDLDSDEQAELLNEGMEVVLKVLAIFFPQK